jgi:hypothetical protein
LLPSTLHPLFDPMPATIRRSIQLLACTICLSTLSACGWVDSTGAQVTVVAIPTALQNKQPLAIAENTIVIAELTGKGSSLHNWTWTADNKNEIPRCMGINGFDINYAVTSISDACTSQTDCLISISETASVSGTQFTVKTPKLKVPLAMSYSLSTMSEDGAIVTRRQLFCAVSINEAPQAFDDDYIARRGNSLIVDAGDSDNLLSNDLDDIDFRNSQLQVIITPVKSPHYAALFNLDAHGGFFYQALADAPVNSSGQTEDSFVYAITDGIHTVNAMAFIKTIDTNEVPKQLQQIPDFVFSAADGLNESHVRQKDLSQYFWDPDGDRLTFQSGDIDSTLGLTLSTEGILTADASIFDVNQWRATVMASDGVESTEGTFVITVRLPDRIKLLGGNQQPTVTDIKNTRYSGVFSYDVSTFFTDVDRDDQLTFTAGGLPTSVQIRADGVIEGSVDASNQGHWFVQVTAEDGYGGSVTDGFNLILEP